MAARLTCSWYCLRTKSLAGWTKLKTNLRRAAKGKRKPMKRVSVSRREFIRLLSLSLGAAIIEPLLSACGEGLEAETVPTPPFKKAVSATPHAQKSPSASSPPQTAKVTPAQQAASSSKSGTAPDLAVARRGNPMEMVRRAIAALGGMERFISPGETVVVKPNICVAYHTYEYAATTNPWVVGAVVSLCLKAGARRVLVMDAPFGGSAEEAYSITGIAEQVRLAGGSMVVMSRLKYKQTTIPGGRVLQKTQVYDDVLSADALIDVPILKHHSLARLTLGMKNLMGVVRDRPAMHDRLGEKLADLAGFLRPRLTIIDAVRILRAHGPSGGNLNDVEKADTIIASPDIVAADSYAAYLFGLNPADLSYIQAGTAAGLGRSDLDQLKIEEINIGA